MPKLSFQYVRQHLTETLLEFLVRRFKYHGLIEWEERILSGNVLVNGKNLRPETLLRTGHKIVYEPPLVPEPEVDTGYAVLFEDDVLLAVDKSGNIPTSPSGKYWRNCLVHHLKEERGLEELHAVHRLDRETSGINLFTKSKDTARSLGRDFMEGRVGKIYSAVLRGRLPGSEVLLNAPIARDEASSIHIRQKVRRDGRPAQTRYTLVSQLSGAALVRIATYTGRTHQIRVHAEYFGCPVWGDKLYGREEEDFIQWVANGERNSTSRHLLHAAELTFSHPQTGRRIQIQSPPKVILELYSRENGQRFNLEGLDSPH